MQTSSPALQSSGVSLLDWLWIVLIFVLIWLFCYKLVYPTLLLRYYGHYDGKNLFWPLFLLYGLTGLQLIAYWFFKVDPYSQEVWLKWASLVLAVLFFLWFLIVFLRHRTA